MFAMLKIGFMLKMAQKIYMKYVRPILAKKVEASETKVDDAFLSFIDLFFDPAKGMAGLATLGIGEFYKMACETYAEYRQFLLDAIDDPDAFWDDFLMKAMDKSMSYQRTPEAPA